MASPRSAGGAGFIAFAGLGVPSITAVRTAIGKKGGGGLAAAWDTLDNRQRNAGLGIQALQAQYHGLAKAMEPRVFQVFNSGLHLAESLLGPFGQLAASAGEGVPAALGPIPR